MQKHKRKGRLLFWLLGYLFAVGAPLSATLSCFPLWRARGTEAVLAGGTLLLCALCALPLFRAVREYLRSPAVWSLWLFSLLFFLLVQSIAPEMSMICFFGLIGNLLGALCFRAANRRRLDRGQQE